MQRHRRTPRIIPTLLLSLGVLWSCSEKKAPSSGTATEQSKTSVSPPPQEAPKPAEIKKVSKRYQVAEPLGPTGSVTGVVRLLGEPPVNKPVVYHQRFREQQAEDLKFCDPKNVKKDFIVVMNGGLTNTLVEIKGIKEGKAFPKAALLENKDCRFEPRVVLAPPKQRLIVANRDPIMHNAQIVFHESVFWNHMLPAELKKSTPKMIAPGLYRVGCSLHDWMQAYIQVMSHPYFAVTDAQGRFDIKDVPPGTYTVRIWHEKLGSQTKELIVQAGSLAELEIEYKK